jgi:hypothetical protein
MVSFKKILREWSLLFEQDSSETPESLRVLDFDHTVAFTGEMVHIISPEGKRVGSLDSEEYSHHSFSREEAMAGYHYDFREFNDVDSRSAKENIHVTEILRNFINAGPGRIILILTARNQEAEVGIRNYLDTIGIDHSTIKVVGVGASAPQKKVDVVKNLLDQNETIKKVSFFDDSEANTDEMLSFLSTYTKPDGDLIDFDIAKVDKSGKLIRRPGYRSKRSSNVKSR